MASIDLAAQILDVAEAASELVTANLALVGVSVPDPQAGLGVTLPDPIEIAAATLEVGDKVVALANANLGMVKVNLDLAFSTADLVLATANLALWNVNLARGLAALGGSGGDGGAASSGTDFFGGGIGGAGGAGGAGATSITDGGNGGSGGDGGGGGFGAGGGAGGASGAAGENGNAVAGGAGGGGGAGFGAGAGADGDGNSAGGGSGLGGSIFVRTDGKLLIKGNAHFLNNYVAGGSTASAFGAAGGAAGTDLFIMKDSTVTLQPGSGNTIQFDGTIADDSAATDGGYQYAAGDGADIHIGGAAGGNGGLVVFNGANTYSGHTILEGATLSAVVGVGVNDLSLIRFNGSGSIAPNLLTNRVASTMSLDSVGTFLLQEDYLRRAGLNPGETAWTGSGGFASALSSGVKVTLGSVGDVDYDQKLVWGRDGFFVPFDVNGSGNSGVLTFGSEYSKGAVEFTNNVELNNQVARVAVYNNRNFLTSNATLSGNWTNAAGTGSTLIVGDSGLNSPYSGTLFMTGTSTLNNLVVAGGTLSTYNADGSNGKLFKTTSDVVVMADAIAGVASSTSRLQLFSDESVRNVNVLSGGSLTLTQALAASGNVANLGELNILGGTFAARLDSEGPALLTRLGLDYLPTGYAEWNGQLSVGGTLTNYTSGTVNLAGDMQLGVLNNQGTWNADGNITVAGNITNTGNLLVKGNITTTTGDVRNDKLWAQEGDLSVGRDLLNTATAPNGMTLKGNLVVGRNATNQGLMSLEGDLDVTFNLLNTGTLSIVGYSTVGGNATNQGLMSHVGNLDVTFNLLNSGTLGIVGDTTVGGNATNTATGVMSLTGNLGVVGNLQNSNTFAVTGDTQVTGNLSNSAGSMSLVGSLGVVGWLQNDATLIVTNNSAVHGNASNTGTLTIGGNNAVDGDVVNTGTLSVGSAPRPSIMVVGGSFYNSGANSRFTVTGSTTVGTDMTNDGVMGLTGNMDVGGNFRNNKLAAVTGTSTVAANFTNAQSMVMQGDLSVGRDYLNTNNGVLSIVGNTVVAGNMINAGNLLQTGNLTLPAASVNTGLLTNTGFWNFGSDATVKAGQLAGTGTFCLSSSNNVNCTGGQAAMVNLELAYNSLYTGVFAGTGGLTKTGNGGLYLTADQTFTGGLTVNNGTVTAMGTMADTLDIVVGTAGTYIVGKADLVRSFVNNAPHSVILNADLTTTAGFQNNGRLLVNGDLVVNGSTQSLERVLNLSASGLTGSANGKVEIAAETSLRLVQQGNTTYLGAFTRSDNDSSLVKEGSGTLTLGGNVDLRYVTISAGELALAAAGILSSDAIVTVSSNGTLSLITGNQTIEQLLGLGRVNLGANNLYIDNGGDFAGQITGSGSMVVKSGVFNIAGVINSPESGFDVKSGSTTSVASTGVLTVKNLQVEAGGTLTLGTSGNPGGRINASGNVKIAGDLKGSGTIIGSAIVQSGGHVLPGYSPGVLTFNNGLTLESNSLITLEIANKMLAAGTGFDHIAIANAGALSINPGAKLEVKEIESAPFRNGDLLMGETLNLLGFTPGKITGTFGTASMLDVSGNAFTSANTHVVMNLATGNAVGLGNKSLSDLSARAISGNDRAVYSGLLQSSNGGVGQFYGGRFVERLTSAVQSGSSTRTVFNAYNPEFYQSLSDVAQDAAKASLPDWKMNYLGQDGFLTFAGNSYKATTSADDHQAFGTSFTAANVGYVRALGDMSLMFTAGTVNARTDANDFSSSGDGYNGGIALLGRLAGIADTSWHVGLGISSLKLGGKRTSYATDMNFSRVGVQSTVVDAGLETKRGFGDASYFMGRTSLGFGSSNRDGFSESRTGDGLDAMALKSSTTAYTLLDLSLELGTKVASTTDWYGSMGLQSAAGTKSLSASFDNNQAQVNVDANSALNANSKLMTGLRYRDQKGNTFEASIGGSRGWDNKTNSLANVSFFMPF